MAGPSVATLAYPLAGSVGSTAEVVSPDCSSGIAAAAGSPQKSAWALGHIAAGTVVDSLAATAAAVAAVPVAAGIGIHLVAEDDYRAHIGRWESLAAASCSEGPLLKNLPGERSHHHMSMFGRNMANERGQGGESEDALTVTVVANMVE